MLKRIGSISALAAAIALAVVSAAVARPAHVATATAATASSCKSGVTIGMLAPITGPAASIGGDQLHWAQFYVSQWNKVRGHVKIKIQQGDDQLDPSKASTLAQSFASNAKVMGVIGPAGSDEVQAVAPILRKAGLAFTSGSATRVSLTNGTWKGFFFRVVPNDNVQGPTDATFMFSKLGVKSGDSVMVVDDQESYSTGLADIVGQSLSGKGVKVDRESISQKDTDFSSLIAKVTPSTKVVFLPFQLASQAQLFAQQLKAQGKTALTFGSDGTYDVKNFTAGSYVSFFAPDVTTIAANAKVVAQFHKQFPGATSPFGAPNYVVAQMYANAITKACKDNKITRTEFRKDLAKVKLPSTILGTPIRFTANGDLAGAKFHIFKIVNGKYQTVQ
jgi:branched-chain amino acid transport system substrate-binding protein